MGAAYLKGPPALPTIWHPHWCSGKHPFESAIQAQEVANRSEYAMQIYRCATCGRFHIGGAPKRGEASKTVARTLIRD